MLFLDTIPAMVPHFTHSRNPCPYSGWHGLGLGYLPGILLTPSVLTSLWPHKPPPPMPEKHHAEPCLRAFVLCQGTLSRLPYLTPQTPLSRFQTITWQGLWQHPVWDSNLLLLNSGSCTLLHLFSNSTYYLLKFFITCLCIIFTINLLSPISNISHASSILSVWSLLYLDTLV